MRESFTWSYEFARPLQRYGFALIAAGALGTLWLVRRRECRVERVDRDVIEVEAHPTLGAEQARLELPARSTQRSSKQAKRTSPEPFDIYRSITPQPRPQHSAMFGQRASSQIVCRLAPSTSFLTSK